MPQGTRTETYQHVDEIRSDATLFCNLSFSNPTVNSFPHNHDFLTNLYIKPFENIVGKEENAGKPAFSSFPTMFSSLPNTNFQFSVTFILSSANAFNLD